MQILKKKIDNNNERCVCCGCDTGVPYDTPISRRVHYIRGSGQLCGECYLKLYVRNDESDSGLSTGEMNELITLCKKEKP